MSRFIEIYYCVMQMPGFILHGWLCYYNDAEVVKKNVQRLHEESINSPEDAMNIAYEGEKKIVYK